MKKLLALFMLLSLNASAGGFIDTLGAQCAEILLYLDRTDYPNRYDNVKTRNSQLWALQKCLNIYKENGGDLGELEKRYLLAQYGYEKDFSECIKIIKKNNDETCLSLINTQFKRNIQNKTHETLYYRFTEE